MPEAKRYNNPYLPLKFRTFLVEMETSATEKENLRTIIQKLIQGDKNWLNQQEILWGDKGSYWILNYKPGGRNEFNRLVRGLVVAKPSSNFGGDPLTLIKSFPFIRFYNKQEKEADPVDFSNAEMLEKLDGTFVGLFFPHNDPNRPEFHTRKMMSTHKDDMERKVTTFKGKEARFLPEIKNFVDQLRFSDEDLNYTYMFEFLHEVSHVLTKYNPDQYGLYLLGGRNVSTHRELTEDQLDETATRIGSKRARRWDAIKYHNEIEKMFNDMAKEIPDFEGFIFRDKKTGKRVKVKDPEYVRKHHLLSGLNYKKLVPRVLEGEEDEVVAYFPHAKELVQDIKTAYSNYLEKVVNSILKWGNTDFVQSRKLLAQNVMGPDNPDDKFTRNMVMKYHQIKDREELTNTIDQHLKTIALGAGNNAGSPKRLIDMIGLHDEDDDEDMGEI